MVGPVIQALARGLVSYDTNSHGTVTTSEDGGDNTEISARLAAIVGLDLGSVDEQSSSLMDTSSTAGLAAIQEVLGEDTMQIDDIDDGFELPPPAVAVDEYLMFAGDAPRTLADINGTPASLFGSTTDGGGDGITVTTDDADIMSLCSSLATAGTLLGSNYSLVTVARACGARGRRSGGALSGRCSRPRQVAVAGAVPLQCALRVGRRRVAARPRPLGFATRRCTVAGAAR